MHSDANNKLEILNKAFMAINFFFVRHSMNSFNSLREICSLGNKILSLSQLVQTCYNWFAQRMIVRRPHNLDQERSSAIGIIKNIFLLRV